MTNKTVSEFDLNKFVVDLVQKNIERLFKGVYKVGTEQYKSLKLKTGLAFQDYLVSASQKYGFTKTILYRDRSVPLYEFYVNMNVRSAGEVLNTDNISNLLNRNKFITIYGSGGSGKSTLFKHFFMNAITHTDYIPIFVELKSLNDEELTLLECIYKSLHNLKFNLEYHYFEESLNSGRYLILLDGFDEVVDSKREKLRKEIIALTDMYDENHYILSSRKSDNLYNGWSKFTDYVLIPLNKNKAIELIRILNYNSEIKEKFLEQLEDNLFEKHQSFCSNPLLLNLMLLTYEEFAEIPEKVHIFYAQAFEVLYSRHDGTKGYKRRYRTGENLGYDDFTKILSAMCVLSYINSKVAFDYPLLKRYIDDAKQITHINNFNTEDYIADLVESVCLLYLDGLKYTFQHRSFQEYFTARFILNLPDKQLFNVVSKIAHIRYSSLQTDKVFDLMLEMDKEKFEKIFIVPILKEIKEQIQDESVDQTYIKWLRSGFKEYGINYSLLGEEGIEDEGDCVSFTYDSNRKVHYIELVNYIVSKYQDIYPELPKPEIYTNKNLNIIKKYGKKDEYSPDIYVNIDDVLKYDDLKKDFLRQSQYYIMAFEFSMQLLLKLEEKHEKVDSVLNQLFEI